MTESPIDYWAEYKTALEQEKNGLSYIDVMTPEDLRAEMRALISMLDAERKMVRELEKRISVLLGEATAQ